MKRDELKNYLEIDKDALDECLMEQAKLYEEAGEAVADAEKNLEMRELGLEELIAKTDKDVRETAAVAGSKITESAVKAEITDDPQVKDLSRKVIELRHTSKLWRAMERSFSQRAEMLKKLVDLHIRTTYGYSIESSTGQARGAVVGADAERNRAAASDVRRKRLEDKK